MTETVTTAADLAALPLGSIVVDPYAATCVRSRVSDPEMPSDWVRVTVTAKGGEHHHRPFLPAEVIRRGWAGYTDADPSLVKPSREDVARTLFQWDIAPDHPQPHPLWDDPHSARLRDLWLSAADAVLALLPGRTEAEVKAEALEEAADSLVVWGVLAKAELLHVSSVRSWLRHRAAALLRGESHV